MSLGSIHDAAANGDLDLVKKIVEQDPRLVNQDDKIRMASYISCRIKTAL